jgi:23S rRNA (pseudouridine1915-N3)-methyltransferase
MKFSDIEQKGWDELAPYLDTCLLPVTGLAGNEYPWEATKALEDLRDALDCLEVPFKGRIVTYPALHYLPVGEERETLVNSMCDKLKEKGFRYVIIVTARSGEELDLQAVNADLFLRITPDELLASPQEMKRAQTDAVTRLWSQSHS